VSLSYLNSRTGETKKTKFIPEDSVSVFANAGCGSIEMRFLIKPTEGFDQLHFKLDQNLQGKMLIARERV
jgi:hypothetical protein